MRITALDTETTGLWWSHGTAVFSLGMTEQVNKKKPRFQFWNFPINPASRRRFCTSSPFSKAELADIRSRFQSPDNLVFIQNARYDVKALCELGVFDWSAPCDPAFWMNIIDLKHLAHLNFSTDSEFGASLKDLTPKYLGRDYDSQEDLLSLVQRCRDFVHRHTDEKTLGKRKADKRTYPPFFHAPAVAMDFENWNNQPSPLYGTWRTASPHDPATRPGKDKFHYCDYWLPRALFDSACFTTSIQRTIRENEDPATFTPSENYSPLANALLQTFSPTELKHMCPSQTSAADGQDHMSIVDFYLQDDCNNTMDLGMGFLDILTERHGDDLERLLSMNRSVEAAVWRMEVTGTPLHASALQSAVETCTDWTMRLWQALHLLSGGRCPTDSQPTDTQVRDVLFNYFDLDSVKQTKNKAKPLDSVDANVLINLKKSLADSAPSWVQPVIDEDGESVALPPGLVEFLGGRIPSPFAAASPAFLGQTRTFPGLPGDDHVLVDTVTEQPIPHDYRANLFIGILLASKKHNKKHGDLIGYTTKALPRKDRAYKVTTDVAVSPLQPLLFASYDESGTATTRFGCREPNLMNIAKAMNPFEKDFPDVSYYLRESPSVRGIFGPPAGYAWYPMDYSQLQLRIFAAASQEEALIQAFLDGWDAHDYMAHRIFNLPEGTKPEDAQRRIAKNVNFGFIFGAGEAKIDATAGRPGLYQEVLRLFPNAHKFIERTKVGIKNDGCVYTLGGYPLAIPLRSNKWRPDILAPAAHAGVNYIVQGTEGEIVKAGIAMCHEFLYCGRSLQEILDYPFHKFYDSESDTTQSLFDRALYALPWADKLRNFRLVKGFDGRIVMQVHDENVFQLPIVIPSDRFTSIGSREATTVIADPELRPLVIPLILKALMEVAGLIFGVTTPVDADLVRRHWNVKQKVNFTPLLQTLSK